MSLRDRRRALSLIRRPPEHVIAWLRENHEPGLLDDDPAWKQLADLMESKDPETIGRLEAWTSKLSRSAMLTRAERGLLDRMQKPERHFALAVSCPWCGASEDVACAGAKNERLKKPHDERRERFEVLAGATTSEKALDVIRNALREGSSLVTRGGWLEPGVFADVRLLLGSVGGRWSHGGTFLFPAGATAEERVKELIQDRTTPDTIEREPGEIVDRLNIPEKRLRGAAAEFAIRLVRGERADVGPDALAGVGASADKKPDPDLPIEVAAHSFMHGYIAGQDAASALRAAVVDLLETADRVEKGEADEEEYAASWDHLERAVELLLD